MANVSWATQRGCAPILQTGYSPGVGRDEPRRSETLSHASGMHSRQVIEMPYGCGSKPMGSHFGVRAPPILVYFSGDWDVHWGYDLDFDPWPYLVPSKTRARLEHA